MSPVVEFEGGEMEEVIEDGPAEAATMQGPSMDAHQVVDTLAGPIKAKVESELEHAEDIADAQTQEVPSDDSQDATEEPATPKEPQQVVDELVDSLVAMWTPANAEAIPEEDPDSDGEETEDEAEEDAEAELDALEEEHFQAAAEDFLAELLEGQA
ncbi:hypothetical protein FRC11_001527 [Ceratobasidium sp. 423]|nr:hypothetical protein FRC11_001527 [Ceratobasidium sp. 423]